MKRYWRVIGGLALLGILAVVVPLSYILYHSWHFEPQEVDTLIVLGCRLYGDIPSPVLRYRLDRALELYEQGLTDRIIVSGAMGPGETVTEAYAMKKYLVARGVNPEHVHMEDRSFNTYENLKYSKEIMDYHGYQSALIVSSDFHIFRALVLARKLGLTAAGAPAGIPSIPILRVRYVLREVPAFYREVFLR